MPLKCHCVFLLSQASTKLREKGVSQILDFEKRKTKTHDLPNAQIAHPYGNYVSSGLTTSSPVRITQSCPHFPESQPGPRRECRSAETIDACPSSVIRTIAPESPATRK
jgi:hypothetical protein